MSQPLGGEPSSSSSVAVRQRDSQSFLLLITGQIEAVQLPGVPSVYCKYCFVYGPDWRQVGGMEEGISATGFKPLRGDRIVLNTPIEATFSSTNPFKWPQIVLSFYGQDAFGNDVVRGYGATHLPTVPGRIKRKCALFLPQSSTAIQRLVGWFTGRRAEFVDPRCVAMAEGREVTRVSTQGFVELTLNAVVRDTKKFGYDLCAQTVAKFSEFPLDWPPTSERGNAGIAAASQQAVGRGPRVIETIHESEEEQHQQQETVHVETTVEEIQQQQVGEESTSK